MFFGISLSADSIYLLNVFTYLYNIPFSCFSNDLVAWGFLISIFFFMSVLSHAVLFLNA